MVTQRPAHVKRPAAHMLSKAEAARRLGVSERQVGRYMADGLLDWGVYPGGRRMVLAASVARFIGKAMDGRL